MTTPLQKLLDAIGLGSVPPIILVGGDNEYLVSDAFSAIREAILERAPSTTVEHYPEGADLARVGDSFRTMSLFGGPRLLVVAEVNAFVTRSEIDSLLQKAVTDWKSAKTERKRASSIAKLLHVVGLIGLDLESTDAEIARALGVAAEGPLAEMLTSARITNRNATRGEADASLIAELANRGGSPGAVLLMKSGTLPKESATVEAIARGGAVVVRDLSREGFSAALERAISELGEERRVRFDAPAVAALRERLGIERVLADKFSRDIPDLRLAVAEAERLATLAGEGGSVTRRLVEEQIAAVAGGARYELGALFAERKPLEAVAKLRDLVAQSRRDDPAPPLDVHYGKFLFALADEVRQMLAIHSFARSGGLDLRRLPPYNRFKETVADTLGERLRAGGIVRQKPHPFALYRKVEAARSHSEEELADALCELAEIDFARKSGGAPAEVTIESAILRFAESRRM
jgi:DNA polymerase III delta subunit